MLISFFLLGDHFVGVTNMVAYGAQMMIPTNWPKSLIEDVAERIATGLGFPLGGDVEQFARNTLRASIVVDDWQNPVPTGIVYVKAKCDLTIWLSPYTGPWRDRVQIATAIGHYFLHSKGGSVPLFVPDSVLHDPVHSRFCAEASWFGAVLMGHHREKNPSNSGAPTSTA